MFHGDDADSLHGRLRTAFEARLFVEMISEAVETRFECTLVFVVLGAQGFPLRLRQDIERGWRCVFGGYNRRCVSCVGIGAASGNVSGAFI